MATTTVIDDREHQGLLLVRARPWDRLLARLRSADLDAQLAAGCSPDADRLRAIRAGMLIAPRARRRVARHWLALLDRAERARESADPRLPLPRNRILAAETEIYALAASLRASWPVPPRGVALARLLLVDGDSPVYDARCRLELRTAIQQALTRLAPPVEDRSEHS